MKKLMFAVAIAVAGGAFATPLVYDYKASVKHFYLRTVKLNNIKSNTHTFKGMVYQKYQKTAALKGFLIQDWDGSLSSEVTGGPVASDDAATAFDMGRSRAFLVVKNDGVEAIVRRPKILPAVLDAKFIDANFKAKKAGTGLAEGTLFVGGETIKAIRPIIDDFVNGKMEQDNLESRTIDAMSLPEAGKAGVTAYADYVWTSIYLFGRYNGPNWYAFPDANEDLKIPFPGFEYDWDQNLPGTLQTGVVDNEHGNRGTLEDVYSYYHDTWMNGAGFGKYFIPGDVKTISGEVCCGLKSSTTTIGFNPILQTLSGAVKGGVFLCTDNAIVADGILDNAEVEDYTFFDADNHRWDEQFVSYRLEHNMVWENDVWQNDLWQDGAVEQETTDVLSGTWTIKYNGTFLAKYGRLWTEEEIEYTADKNGTPVDRQILWTAIKGAAYYLNKSPAFIFLDGTEIYDRVGDANRFNIPFITPQFIKYYGL